MRQLRKEETDARERLLQEVEEVIKLKWPGCSVQPFGSYFSGLSIFLSDVDVTVLDLSLESTSEDESEEGGEQGHQVGREPLR